MYGNIMHNYCVVWGDFCFSTGHRGAKARLMLLLALGETRAPSARNYYNARNYLRLSTEGARTLFL